MFGGFNTAKCETQCRLALGRFKLVRNKKNMQMKASRKEIAELLRSGRQEYARIRVEGIIRENLLLQAYEILELYVELLTVRTQLIAKNKEIPRDMIEAVSSIIYAAQRVSDMPELLQLRAMLGGKYGKEYALEAAADATAAKWQVNHNLMRCLLVEPPQPEDKLAALSDIAQEHGVEWDMSAAARDMSIMTPAAHPGAVGGLAPPAGGPNAIAGPAGGAPALRSGGHVPAAPAPALALQQQAGGPPHPLYSTPQEAAAAAASLAAQARAAADYAAQFAGGAGHSHAAAAAPPPALPPTWLDGPSGAGQQPPVVVAGGAASYGYPQEPQVPYGHQPPPAGTAAGPSGGGARANMEEVQRAYDAALGPPTKGEVASAPPPGASAPAPPPPPGAASGSAELPTPPAPPPAVVDEYEELTRRLEALKKS